MHKSFRPCVNDKDFFTKGLPQPQAHQLREVSLQLEVMLVVVGGMQVLGVRVVGCLQPVSSIHILRTSVLMCTT